MTTYRIDLSITAKCNDNLNWNDTLSTGSINLPPSFSLILALVKRRR